MTRKLFALLAPESDKVLHLDALRFFACLAIVILHFRVYLEGPAFLQAVTDRLEPLRLAVDLFFLISGFVISFVYAGRIRSPADYGNFLQKRVARLVPLHWATAAAFLAIGAAYWTGFVVPAHPGNYDVSCILPNLLLIHAFGVCQNLSLNGVSWSISAEMGLYLAFPLFTALSRRRWIGLCALALIVGALSLASMQAGQRPWYNWTSDFGVLRGVPGFLIGALCYRSRDRLRALKHAEVWLVGLGALFLAGCLLSVPEGYLLVVVYGIGIAGVAASQRSAGKFVRAVAPFGQLTYSIYMLHQLVEIVVISFLGRRLLHLHGAVLDALVATCAIALVPLAYFSLTRFEIPMRRMVSRLRPFSRREPDRPAKIPAGSDW